MASQNQSFQELVVVVFEYVARLKQELADAVASSVSSQEIIAKKTEEADAAKLAYEEYMNIDVTEDGALAEAIEKFKAELLATSEA